MKKYILFTIVFFSLTSHILPQNLFSFRNGSEWQDPATKPIDIFDENGNTLWTRSKLHPNSVNQSQNAVYSIPVKNVKRKFDDIIRMDSIITSSIQGGSMKVLFEYNIDGNITEQLILGNIGNGWFNSWLDYFYYDGKGNLVREISLGWHNTHWDTLTRINYSYNPQGLIFQYVFQDYTNESWNNVTRSTFEYDSSGNENVFLSEKWQDGNWNNNMWFNSYYSDLNLRDSLLVHIWDSIGWQNYSKTFFNYNELTNFLDYFVVVIWTGNSWQNWIRRKIENDSNGNQTGQLDEIWNEGNWEYSVRRFYSYIDLNYIESAYCELWNGNNWVSGDDVILLEYPNGYRVGFITNTLSIYYKTTGVKKHIISYPNNFTLEQNYPNPFNPSTTIKYKIPQLSLVTLKIYDVLGNAVATLINKELPAGSYEVDFDGSNLSSGIFFYRLQAGSIIQTKKMVLMK